MISIDQYIKTATPSGEKGEHSLLFDCPRCKGHKKLEVHKLRRLWHCHKCGQGGSLAGWKKPKTFQDEMYNDPTDSWLEHLALYTPILPGSREWRYLEENRRLSTHMIRDLRPHEGPVTGYCYFPLYSLGCLSQPHYFVGRSFLRHSKRKYLNPITGTFPVTKSGVLWGLHRIRPRQDEVILCEGIFDAVWDRRRVALLGKTLSKQQLEILRQIKPRKVSVMLDGEAGRDAARIAETLGASAGWMVDRFDLPIREDPDSLGNVDLERFRRRYI